MGLQVRAGLLASFCWSQYVCVCCRLASSASWEMMFGLFAVRLAYLKIFVVPRLGSCGGVCGCCVGQR